MNYSEIKAEAFRLAEEANTLCRLEDIGYKMVGVEVFLRARELEWPEVIGNSKRELPARIPYSDEFLGACQTIAVNAYRNNRYEEAMKYCKYVRDSYYISGEGEDETGSLTLGTSLIRNSISKQLKKRPGDFNPERVCAEVEFVLCELSDSPYYNLREARYKKRRAAALCSLTAVEMLAEEYSKEATTLEEAKEAYFFYSLIKAPSDPDFAANQKKAWDNYVSKMAFPVTIAFMNPATWLPAPASADMTWEQYSGLTEEFSKQLRRKPLDDGLYFLFEDEIAGDSIYSAGNYQPCIIDLEYLWKQFVVHPKNQKTDKQVLCFKKKKYNSCLYLGDFVDCCKYLWEQTYKNN